VRACYVDCSPFLRALIDEAGLVLPSDLSVHVGDPDPDELVALAVDAEVVLNGHTAMDAVLLAQLPKLRRIVFLGTGASSYIDLDAAAARGIAIETIRGYGDRAVAEHAFALMLAAARNVTAMDRKLRAGRWDPCAGVELAGKTVGVIGAGGIGLTFAALAEAFGMEVLIYARRPLVDRWADAQASLDAVLARADVLSLHLPLTAETRHFLDAEKLGRMKDGAILVNTARGGLVEEAALLAALKSGRIAHAALDVYEREPLEPDAAIVNAPNTTLSAHAGFKTREASLRLIEMGLRLADR
jgi:D-3-phosphoglycerate dehydrogenase / 2-oxoglutarate reductase